jgi:hypothetical protein
MADRPVEVVMVERMRDQQIAKTIAFHELNEAYRPEASRKTLCAGIRGALKALEGCRGR